MSAGVMHSKHDAGEKQQHSRQKCRLAGDAPHGGRRGERVRASTCARLVSR